MGFAICLNQTYSCGTVQFKVTVWWGQGVDINEFKLHPDTTTTVPPGHPFPPSTRVPVSDPSKAGMTARAQNFTMGGPGGGLFASAQTPWRTSGYSQGYSSYTNRRMYQAACGSKVFVTWTRHDSRTATTTEWGIGRLATFTSVRDNNNACAAMPSTPAQCSFGHASAAHERAT